MAFTIIQDQDLDKLKGKLTHRSVFLFLCDHADNDTGESWYPNADIGAEAGIKSRTTVTAVLKDLEKWGLITIRQRWRNSADRNDTDFSPKKTDTHKHQLPSVVTVVSIANKAKTRKRTGAGAKSGSQGFDVLKNMMEESAV